MNGGVLFADAEGGEDHVEDLFDIGVADDVAEGLKGLAEIEGDELGGGTGEERGLGGEEVVFDALEADSVAGVDGDGVVEGEGPAEEDDGADGIPQGREAGTVLAGDGDGAGEVAPVRVNADVGLVKDDEVALPGGGRDGDAGGSGGGKAGVDDFENEVGAVEFGAGALDANLFDGVAAVAEAGGVHEAEGDAVNLDDFLDGVAGGAGGGADDGALETEKAVEEAAFADVGLADDGGAGAVAEDAALFGGVEKAAGAGEEAGEAGVEGGAGVWGDVLLGEVDAGLDVGEDLNERGAQVFGLATDGAGELFVGGADGESALGVDEVHDGLGLGEVDFTVEKGALRELAGVCMAGAGGEEGLEDALGDEEAAVAMELEGGFSGVAGGAMEQDDNALIEGEAGGIAGGGEVETARREVGKGSAGLEDAGADVEGAGAGEADDGNGGLTGGGGDGGDGVVDHAAGQLGGKAWWSGAAGAGGSEFLSREVMRARSLWSVSPWALMAVICEW